MVQVSYPGVYIEEVPSGVRTITPVSTSIAAFFGRATTGPINKAQRLLSLADYERTFGPSHPLSDLADSVRLFFLNGGTECYVVRLARGAVPAAGQQAEASNDRWHVTVAPYLWAPSLGGHAGVGASRRMSTCRSAASRRICRSAPHVLDQ